MKYFLDTEFVEDGETIMPISLALVREDGPELYIEFVYDEEKAQAHDFVRENVLPHLRGQEQYTREQAAERIAHFLGVGKHPAESCPDDIEIWAYFADYDWVLFCQIFGTMMDLPDGCPRFCMDLMQWWTQLGRPDGVKPPKPAKIYDALADAQWNRQFHNNLDVYVARRSPSEESFQRVDSAYFDCPVHGVDSVAVAYTSFEGSRTWKRHVCFKCHAEVIVRLVEQYQKEIPHEASHT